MERYFLEPYDYVMKGDKDSMYERIKVMSEQFTEEEFNALLIQLMDTSNIDLLSTGNVARYAIENKVCFLLPNMETKYDFYKSLPGDTTWSVQIRSDKFRLGGPPREENSYSLQVLNKGIIKLQAECR